MALALLTATGAYAQFEKGKAYVGASLTGLNMSYNGSSKFNFGVQAQGGYFIADDVLLHATVGYDHSGKEGVIDKLALGVGARYYIEQNGIFLGLNCKYLRAGHEYNDFMPEVEVGYAFFVNNSVTLEPAIYYDQSFKNHSDYSTVGLRLGVGVYLFKK